MAIFSTPETSRAAQTPGASPIFTPELNGRFALDDEEEQGQPSTEERRAQLNVDPAPMDPVQPSDIGSGGSATSSGNSARNGGSSGSGGSGDMTAVPGKSFDPDNLVPELPRIDTSSRSAPEYNEDKAQRLRTMVGLAALGSAIAPQGGRFQAIGAGLTSGFGAAKQEMDEQYAAEQEAFNQFLADAQEFNRSMEAKEKEMRADVAQERMGAAQDRELERLEEELRNQRPDVQALTEKRKAGAESERAQAEAQEALARLRDRREAGGDSGSSSDDQKSTDQLYSELKENSMAMSQASRQWADAKQQLNNASATTDNSSIQQRAERLQKRIDELARQNARIRSRIQDRESGASQNGGSGSPSSGQRGDQRQPTSNRPASGGQGGNPSAPRRGSPQSGQAPSDTVDIKPVLEEARRIEQDSGRPAALQHVKSLIKAGRIGEEANAVLDSLGVPRKQ